MFLFTQTINSISKLRFEGTNISHSFWFVYKITGSCGFEGASGCLKCDLLLQAGPKQNSGGDTHGFVLGHHENLQRWEVHSRSGQPTQPLSYPQGDMLITIRVVWTSPVPAAVSPSCPSLSPRFPSCRHQGADRCHEAVSAPNWTSPAALMSPEKLTECIRSPSQVSDEDTKQDRPQDRSLQSSFSEHQKLLCLCLEDNTIQGLKKVFQVSVSKGYRYANIGKLMAWSYNGRLNSVQVPERHHVILYFKISLKLCRVQPWFMSSHFLYFSVLHSHSIHTMPPRSQGPNLISSLYLQSVTALYEFRKKVQI